MSLVFSTCSWPVELGQDCASPRCQARVIHAFWFLRGVLAGRGKGSPLDRVQGPVLG